MKRTHRRKELTEVQVLKRENRELRAELNKALRRIKSLERTKHINVEEVYDQDPPDMEQFDVEVKCSECYQGNIKSVDFGFKIMHVCTECSWRKVTNK